MATLGIRTNTRLLATAIINSGCLVDYSIHLHKQPWSPSKANLIINSLEACVRRYCIKRIVLSIPHEIYQTEALQYLFSSICRHFEKKGITIITQETEALYSLCSSKQKKTKRAIMEAIAQQFPELNYYLFKEQRNKSKYYSKLFDAVAAVVVQEMK
jgi:hypothetical protein